MSLNCARTTSKENGDMASVGYARVSSSGQELDVQSANSQCVSVCSRRSARQLTPIDPN
jgi:hypothetical protein